MQKMLGETLFSQDSDGEMAHSLQLEKDMGENVAFS